MRNRWLTSPKAIVLSLALLTLFFIIACGGTAATAVPVATEAAQQAKPTAVVVAAATKAPAVVATAVPQPTAVPQTVATIIRGGHVNMTAVYELRPSWVHESVTLTFFTIPLFNGILQYDYTTEELFDIVCGCDTCFK